MAVQDYELLLKVRADLLDAVKGMNGLSQSIGGVSDSAKVAGESADEAAARIKAMVQTTSQQSQVVESARSIAERAAQQAKSSTVDYDAQAAAIKRSADATALYRERMAGNAGSSAIGAISSQRAELVRLVGQIDPTVAALGRLDAQQSKLNQLRKAGVVGLDDFTRYNATIEASRVALTSASGAVHNFSLNNAAARRELSYITKDLATGQYGRLSQSALTLASRTGLISLAFSKAGLAIGGTTAAMALLAIQLIKGYLAEQELNTALIATGNYAGKTSTELRNLANDIGGTTGKYADASKAVLLLAQSGKVSGEGLNEAAKGAVALAALTGESIDKAVAAFVKFQDDPVKAIKALDDQYHFLTTSTYLQIQALQEQGDTQAAADLAQKTAADALETRRLRDVENLGSIQRGWNSLKEAISGTMALIKGIGSQDVSQQLDQLYFKVGAAQNLKESTLTRFIPGISTLADNRIKALYAQITTLREQAFQDQKKAASDSTGDKTQDAGKAGADVLHKAVEQYATASKKYSDEVKKLKDAAAAAIKAAPNDASAINAQLATALAGAKAAYDKSLPKARKGRGDTAEQNAALAAQQQLIKLLGDEQGAVDPLVKVWATYNDQVTKANALADKAKTLKGANVTAIDAERDALIQAYAAARDKSLAALAEKDQKAWEKLRDSLHTPVETKVDTALAQLKQLNDFLAKGTINAQQYADALKAIGDKVVGNLPTYKGPGAAVGGPAGELQKNFSAQSDLDKAYKAQLAALDAFRSTDLAKQKIYDEAKAKLDADYAQKSHAIEIARQQLTLSASADFFGQVAQLQHSSNNKIAAIGKAAAIAQAMIKTYESATSAYAALAGIPIIGPALGAAAAAVAVGVGLANVAQIRAQPSSFDGGGYTGAGGRLEPAGIVHRGEVVFSQDDVARHGGASAVEALRLGYPAYADGGFVDAIAGNRGPAMPDIDTRGTRSPSVSNKMRVYVLQNEDQLAQRLAQHPATEKAIVTVAGENGTAIRAKW